jgi:tetratricopeptide (TPR) repeat protein
VKVIAQYVFTAFFPLRLCFFHHLGNRFLIDPEERRMLQRIDKHFFVAVALIGTFMLLGAVTGTFFWAMWFLVLLAAFSQFKILGQFFAERYMYPAVVGFVAVLASLPEPWYWILVGLYVARTYFFIPVFRTNGDLYENGIKQEPAEACNHVNLSDWYLICQQQLQLASYHIDRSIILDPSDFKANLNKSTMFIFLRNWPAAIVECDKAIEKAKKKVATRFVEIIEGQKQNCQRMIDNEREQASAEGLRPVRDDVPQEHPEETARDAAV